MDIVQSETLLESTQHGIYAAENIEMLVLRLLQQISNRASQTSSQHKRHNKYCAKEPETGHEFIQLLIADRRRMNEDGFAVFRAIRFPQISSGRRIVSSQNIGQALRVLDIMHDAILSDTTVTKRDMYYRDVPLFIKQSTVDQLVDNFAASFGVPRHALHVRATYKGLVCGSGIVINQSCRQGIHVNDTEGTLIPTSEEILDIQISPDVSWILIVEKDAIFQLLCQLRATEHPMLPGRGVIITGKGYPDVATRQLVKSLSDKLARRVPILALVDNDPYGMDILSVYKYGSLSLKHDNRNLAAQQINWIGLSIADLQALDIDKDSLIPLSQSDTRKILSMLNRPRSIMPDNWRRELMHVLFIRRKAEIEIVASIRSSSSTCPLMQYLFRKIRWFGSENPIDI